MVRKVEWSAKAIEDLIGMRDYLLQKCPGNAEVIIRQIESGGDRLIENVEGRSFQENPQQEYLAS